MKNSKLLSSLIFTIILICYLVPSKILAQDAVEVGKLFTKAEAAQIYGNVTESISINSNLLKKLADKAGKYIMFYYKNGVLKIFNEKRIELYPNEGGTIDPNETLRLFSTSKLNELLTLSNADVTVVENREKLLTITAGMNTLEFSTACPPICL